MDEETEKNAPEQNIEDFTREYLRRIDRKLGAVGTRLGTVEQDVCVLKESIRRIDARVASMDSHMAGFYSASRWSWQACPRDPLRQRQRGERRGLMKLIHYAAVLKVWKIRPGPLRHRKTTKSLA